MTSTAFDDQHAPEPAEPLLCGTVRSPVRPAMHTCTREFGHDGPCALVPLPLSNLGWCQDDKDLEARSKLAPPCPPMPPIPEWITRQIEQARLIGYDTGYATGYAVARASFKNWEDPNTIPVDESPVPRIGKLRYDQLMRDYDDARGQPRDAFQWAVPVTGNMMIAVTMEQLARIVEKYRMPAPSAQALIDQGAKAEQEKMQPRLAIASQLANIAYNWSQHSGKVLSERECESLKKLVNRWDESK